MEEFYTREEAAHILGVSTRQVDYYIRDRRLVRIREGKRSLIPRDSVDNFYLSKVIEGGPPSRDELMSLRKRVESLEKRMEVMQKGLGFGASSPKKTETELKILFGLVMADLGRPGWPLPRVMEFSEELHSLREEDLEVLMNQRGPEALLPFMDLAQRMIAYVETHDRYPEPALQAIRDRVIQGRKVLLTLLQVTLSIDRSPYSKTARILYTRLGTEPDFFSQQIGRYISLNSENTS
jgi:excisionase family DNA binding protein